MEIRLRLALFYRRLKALPAFSSHDEALAELSRVLTEIEDEFSGVSRDVTGVPKRTDGRMYPPHPDYAKKCDLPNVTLYAQTGHLTYIGADGSILIVSRRTMATELEKCGKEGGRIQI